MAETEPVAPLGGAAKRKPRHRKRYSIVIHTGGSDLQANHVGLFQPALADVAKTVEAGLQAQYKEVSVEVVECPDLAEWCGLADKGLCGNARLADVGGVPYMMDPKYHHITYQMPDVVKTCGMQSALVIGAGAASRGVVGKNAELMPNTRIPGPTFSRYAKMDFPQSATPAAGGDAAPADGDAAPAPESDEETLDVASSDRILSEDKVNIPTSPPAEAQEAKDDAAGFPAEEVPVVGNYPSEECGCLANLFLSEGKPGPVLHVKVKQRTGELSFSNAIRAALQKHPGVGGDKQIGLGGVFKLVKGKVKAHIMPDFNPVKMEDGSQEVQDWLRFFEFGPDLVMLSTLITDDPTPDKHLHLRCEHTHFYTLNKSAQEGGHYHNDVTPDIVEYEGYFSLAEYIYRVEDAVYNIETGRAGKLFL